ncbi:MAG TPA: hypothetical protein PLV59_00090 [Candidatus Dojkabacteria bacterium]|nr:hypothetical protein [Candidatus Dojkabacteria bacterium]
MALASLSIPNEHGTSTEVPSCFVGLAAVEAEIAKGSLSPNSLFYPLKSVFEYMSSNVAEALSEDEVSLVDIAHLHYLTLRYVNDQPLYSDGIISNIVSERSRFDATLRNYLGFLSYINKEWQEIGVANISMDQVTNALHAYRSLLDSSFLRKELSSKRPERKVLQFAAGVSILLLIALLLTQYSNDGDEAPSKIGTSSKTPTPISQPSQFQITSTAALELEAFPSPSPSTPTGPSPEPLTMDTISSMSEEDILKLVPAKGDESKSRFVSTVRRNIVITIEDSGYILYDVLSQKEVTNGQAGVILLDNENGDYFEFPFHSNIESMVQSMEINGINGSVVKYAQVSEEGKNIFQNILANLIGTKGQGKYVFSFETAQDFQIVSDFACWGVELDDDKVFSIVVYLDKDNSYRIEVVGVDPEVINEKY